MLTDSAGISLIISPDNHAAAQAPLPCSDPKKRSVAGVCDKMASCQNEVRMTALLLLPYYKANFKLGNVGMVEQQSWLVVWGSPPCLGAVVVSGQEC